MGIQNMNLDLKQKYNFKNIVVLTGAGISAESGIKTFRDQNGLWEGHNITDVASPFGFEKNPSLVHEFYNLRREQLFEVSPNPAHLALEKLERNCDSFHLITQNVDDLHERAGSKKIYHMHGELRKIKNIQTGEVKYFEEQVPPKDYILWRPDIVWFGEQVKYMDEIISCTSSCDLFICIGTSNNVYPAAGLVHNAKKNSAVCIELNLEETQLSSLYDHNIYGAASEVVPKIVAQLTV